MTSPLDRLAAAPERFPGALLLSGEEEKRLEAEALRLAAALLCPAEDPERRCHACRRVFSSLHPDLLLVAPEGVQIRVDRIREALLFGAGRPYEAARRVAIVSRAEQLGVEAGNALLKALEEPGERLRWILTTRRPEALLPTIRSRCTMLILASLSRPQRVAAWQSRGFSEEEAEDLALWTREAEDASSEDLEEYRSRRSRIAQALHSGLSERNAASLILLAEELSGGDPSGPRLLAELLADAAVSAAATGGLLRHTAVAGALRELARYRSAEALRSAALKATELPPDTRKGNKRLHLEALLLDLYSF